jgi:hypothetical protein
VQQIGTLGHAQTPSSVQSPGVVAAVVGRDTWMSTPGSIEQIVSLARNPRLGRTKGETTRRRTMMSGKATNNGNRDRADKDDNRPRQSRLGDG